MFTAAGLLREARRQKQLPVEPVPPVCLLDPDGDIADHLIATGQADWSTSWACYHSRMLVTTIGDQRVGIVPRVVGGPYAVLIAEQLAASGCQLLLSVTSAGQLAPIASPPYFVLITHALRDEGTSYHYLPPDEPARLDPELEKALDGLDPAGIKIRTGTSWTTDAPFRETQNDIDRHTHDGLAAVEMEAASLYAFATATGNQVVCFAHVTNQMASIDDDFEKGTHNGAADALTIITATLDLLTPGRQGQSHPARHQRSARPHTNRGTTSCLQVPLWVSLEPTMTCHRPTPASGPAGSDDDGGRPASPVRLPPRSPGRMHRTRVFTGC